MKKNICIVLVLLIGLFCLSNNQKNDKVLDKNNNEQMDNQNVLDQGEYYCIYKGPLTEVIYHIYNSNGDVVLEETTDRPLAISMIGNNIVDISIGFGSGIIEHQYYDIITDCFSKKYLDVLACSEELIAYIGGEDQKGFEGRKVIVENIFDDVAFYKEYELDFSEVLMPVEEASFANDCSELKLKYVSGKEQLQKVVSLKLR